MKQKNSMDNLIAKHPFLDKFAGKVNMITKHGQITNDKGFKLPLINNVPIHRSNTMLLTRQKSDVYSFSSQGHRLMPQKTKTINLRASKYLVNGKDKILADVSNNFMKSKFKQQHHKTFKKQTFTDSSQGKTFCRNPVSQRLEINPIFKDEPKERGQNEEYSQYKNFMAELQKVGKTRRGKMLVI